MELLEQPLEVKDSSKSIQVQEADGPRPSVLAEQKTMGGGKKKDKDKNASILEKKRRMEQELAKIQTKYADVIAKQPNLQKIYKTRTPAWCENMQSKMTAFSKQQNSPRADSMESCSYSPRKDTGPKLSIQEQIDRIAPGTSAKDIVFDIDFDSMSSKQVENFQKLVKKQGIRDMKLYGALNHLVDKKKFQEKYLQRKKRLEIQIIRDNDKLQTVNEIIDFIAPGKNREDTKKKYEKIQKNVRMHFAL